LFGLWGCGGGGGGGGGGVSVMKDVQNVLLKFCDVLVGKYIVAADR
jgi:hypothetical protein